MENFETVITDYFKELSLKEIKAVEEALKIVRLYSINVIDYKNNCNKAYRVSHEQSGISIE